MMINWMQCRHVTRAIALTALAGTALALGGCASNSKGTLGLDNAGRVQGRDLGRGGAESGGLSSVDPSGNAADYSIYDARQSEQQHSGQ